MFFLKHFRTAHTQKPMKRISPVTEIPCSGRSRSQVPHTGPHGIGRLTSTIDHCRSRCKGWIFRPIPYTYIQRPCHVRIEDRRDVVRRSCTSSQFQTHGSLAAGNDCDLIGPDCDDCNYSDDSDDCDYSNAIWR